MISKRQAKETYPSSTSVIHKGDAGWVSDRQDRPGESYGTNPMATVRHRREHRAIVPDVDPNKMDVGDRWVTDDGRDGYEWRVAEEPDRKERDQMRRVWRLVATHRNAAL